MHLMKLQDNNKDYLDEVLLEDEIDIEYSEEEIEEDECDCDECHCEGEHKCHHHKGE